MILSGIWQWILNLLGIKKTASTDKQQSRNTQYTSEYQDIRNINFTALFANKLATLTTAESTFNVEGKNKRAEFLNEIGNAVWDKIKKITAMAFGTGGCLIVPYVQNGKIFFDIVSQDRLCINSRIGDKITNAVVLADMLTINDVTYYRFVNYEIDNNNLLITNKITTQYARPAEIEQWSGIRDISIANVDRVPFGYIKSPVDNRRCSDDYGVPLTYGCKAVIDEIYECLEQIRNEFKLKKVKLQVDERDFDKDDEGRPIITSDLFMAGRGDASGKALFNIFDPALRDSSYYNRLTNLFELLEKSVGTSKGILTTPESRGATATEIKAGLYDTYAIVDDMRKSIAKGMEDFLYACDILANYYNLSPSGEYAPIYDWSYSMIENSAETWQQLKDGQSMGTISKAEVRAWQTGETLEDAQKKIDEIREREPNMAALMGMGE